MANSLRYIARFTLQASSPLMIAGGEEDPLNDNSLARDANRLPMLPATTLAGVLRAAVGDKANGWFGYVDGSKGDRSALTLTDGLFHWSDDKPRDGLDFTRPAPDTDPLCQLVLNDAPILRDHNRLNEAGVVDGDGKFNRVAVPTGARFTFEMRATGDDSALNAVVDIIKGGLSLGGASRSGYGAMICVASGVEHFDLEKPADQERYKAVCEADIGTGSLIVMSGPKPNAVDGRHWTLTGQIEGPLLIGAKPQSREENRAPYMEKRIDWTGNPAAIKDATIIPASSIKGPLRHRTLFHLREEGRRSGRTPEEVADLLADLLIEIFGTEKGVAKAGILRFHDVPISNPTDITLTHVSLDRFTGGARSGALFTDRMLWQPTLEIRIDELKPLTEPACKAFEAALNDMAMGLCGIGAEWGEGAGILIGKVEPPSVATTVEEVTA